MATREIQSEDWEAVCNRISELRQQALLTIEVVRPDGRRDEVARDVLLQSIVLDRSDACNDRISLNVGAQAHKPLTHVILQPIHIRLRPGENGSFNPLQIEAESGTTVLTFRPALRPDILQGLRA